MGKGKLYLYLLHFVSSSRVYAYKVCLEIQIYTFHFLELYQTCVSIKILGQHIAATFILMRVGVQKHILRNFENWYGSSFSFQNRFYFILFFFILPFVDLVFQWLDSPFPTFIKQVANQV